jgi:hypothetical protein
MVQPRIPVQEISARGKELYQELRPKVETPENIGKEIVIDIESGDYEIATEGLAAGKKLRMRHPDALLYGARIGYNAVYAIGGALERTAP